MNKRKKFIWSVFFCVLLCYANSAAQIKEDEKSFIRLKFSNEHLDIFYNLAVKFDGKVIFEPIHGVNVKNKIENNISEEQLKALISEIDKSKFFSLQDSYTPESKLCPWYMLDSPTIVISVKLNGKEKTITHYLGCGEKTADEDALKPFPKPLSELENKILATVKIKIPLN